MKVSLKSPDLEALRSTVYGVLWTKHGLQIVRPGDYIVRAATGCTYRLKEDTVHKYYNIRGNPDNIKEFAQSLAKANKRHGKLEDFSTNGTNYKPPGMTKVPL